jgi:uncharacterized OsmC-like protein
MNAPAKVPVVVNGVNVTQLMETIAAIKERPTLAHFEFRARNNWIGGTQNLAGIQSYLRVETEAVRDRPFEFLADEPPVLCGRDEGANPVEYLLAALSMCVTTSIAAHAAARGIRIEAMESELSGDLDVRGFLGLSGEVRKGYQKITMRMRIRTNGSASVLRQLADFSPVYDVVSRSVPVDLTVETY